jgi:hypothetical protein
MCNAMFDGEPSFIPLGLTATERSPNSGLIMPTFGINIRLDVKKPGRIPVGWRLGCLLVGAGADQEVVDFLDVAGFGFHGLGYRVRPFEIYPAAAFGFGEINHLFNH